MKSADKTIYELAVENKKSEKGRYYDQILINTDNKALPIIRIPVVGNIL